MELGNLSEYLDALEKMPRVMDIATQVPHGSVRAYVMGERGARNEDPTADDLIAMAQIVQEGIEAGALGFTSFLEPCSTELSTENLSRELLPAQKNSLQWVMQPLTMGGGVVEVASRYWPWRP